MKVVTKIRQPQRRCACPSYGRISGNFVFVFGLISPVSSCPLIVICRLCIPLMESALRAMEEDTEIVIYEQMTDDPVVMEA